MTLRTAPTTAVAAALLAALVVASVLVAGVPVAGATSAVITVDDDEGAAAYQSIDAAVDAAESGDTIRVRPGTYEGTVAVGKSLTIVGVTGDDERGPRSDAPVVRSGDGPAFRLTSGATGTSVRGFVLEANLSVAPRGSLQSVTVSDNRFVGSSLVVSLDGESGLSVSDVAVERNVFEAGGVVVGIAALFDPLVISGEIGVMKPHAAAYEAVLTRCGRPASEVVFIDDRIENIDGARASGMHGIHYKAGMDLAAALQPLLTIG